MKYFLYFAISIISHGLPLRAMTAPESRILDQFCRMRVYQISDPKFEQLFKMSLKMSIIRGHQLWGLIKHNHEISRSIPGAVLATARYYLSIWIKDQKKPLAQSIQRVQQAIDEEYYNKIESRPWPIRLLQGNFTNTTNSTVNAIFQYYGLQNFDAIRDYLLIRCEKYDADCAFVFFDTGVRRGLIGGDGNELGSYVLLKKMFVPETHEDRREILKRKTLT